MVKKVFVSDCYDLMHSGHVEFFKQASQYGDLYVCIGSDATFLEYKHRKPMFPHGCEDLTPNSSLQPIIDFWLSQNDVLALKFPGAGGGGYLALVVNDSNAFCAHHPEAFGLQIRRE